MGYEFSEAQLACLRSGPVHDTCNDIGRAGGDQHVAWVEVAVYGVGAGEATLWRVPTYLLDAVEQCCCVA